MHLIRKRLRRIRSLPWFLVGACCIFLTTVVRAQTPSPLQEWQYSAGTVLERMFEPTVPAWRVVIGAGAENRPIYDGAHDYRVQAGPVVSVQYSDFLFASTGDGIGVNILRSDHIHAGVALGYDLGRRMADDVANLHGLGDIGIAPTFKVFGTYVLSKDFPLVLRVDVRQFIGGADGMTGDLGAYLPLPGSSERFMMFLGPSYTFADHSYEQREFGVTTSQALASGHPVYNPHGGSNALGTGLSMNYFVTEHWLINGDAAVHWLLGSARASPITQETAQRAITLSFEYKW